MDRELTPNQIGDAIRAFRAPNCPACEGEKLQRNDPFCRECIEKLPHELQLRVMLREEFIDAFWPAIEHLRTGRSEENTSS